MISSWVSALLVRRASARARDRAKTVESTQIYYNTQAMPWCTVIQHFMARKPTTIQEGTPMQFKILNEKFRSFLAVEVEGFYVVVWI